MTLEVPVAVLVEAISVVVRRDAIERAITGGWGGFLAIVPNQTLCTDGELARVGFMTPPDVEQFVRLLMTRGLTFLVDGRAQDLVVVDQLRGPTTACDWIEFARLPVGEGTGQGTMAACWLFEGPRMMEGIHLRGLSFDVATPAGWSFEESLSRRFQFVPDGEMDKQLKFLRHQDGIDVFLNIETGKEVFVGRADGSTRDPI